MCVEGLDDWQADRAAIRLGFMPWDIWGDQWFETGLSVTDRDFVTGGWRQAWLWAQEPAA
jgi:hypothetical protein